MQLYTKFLIILLNLFLVLRFVFGHAVVLPTQSTSAMNQTNCDGCYENTVIINGTDAECSANPDCVAIREANRVIAEEAAEFAVKCVEKGIALTSDDVVGDFCMFTACVNLFSKKSEDWESLLSEQIKKCTDLVDE